ncbi:hypothetical protein T484DRAFT_1906735, partial [Baffinella frigidus]
MYPYGGFQPQGGKPGFPFPFPMTGPGYMTAATGGYLAAAPLQAQMTAQGKPPVLTARPKFRNTLQAQGTPERRSAGDLEAQSKRAASATRPSAATSPSGPDCGAVKFTVEPPVHAAVVSNGQANGTVKGEQPVSVSAVESGVSKIESVSSAGDNAEPPTAPSMASTAIASLANGGHADPLHSGGHAVPLQSVSESRGDPASECQHPDVPTPTTADAQPAKGSSGSPTSSAAAALPVSPAAPAPVSVPAPVSANSRAQRAAAARPNSPFHQLFKSFQSRSQSSPVSVAAVEAGVGKMASVSSAGEKAEPPPIPSTAATAIASPVADPLHSVSESRGDSASECQRPDAPTPTMIGAVEDLQQSASAPANSGAQRAEAAAPNGGVDARDGAAQQSVQDAFSSGEPPAALPAAPGGDGSGPGESAVGVQEEEEEVPAGETGTVPALWCPEVQADDERVLAAEADEATSAARSCSVGGALQKQEGNDTASSSSCDVPVFRECASLSAASPVSQALRAVPHALLQDAAMLMRASHA